MNRRTALTWIIPVYNGERYIKDAICSILKQKCMDFRIYVIDDGSTDNSASVVKSISDDRLYVFHKKHGGVQVLSEIMGLKEWILYM